MTCPGCEVVIELTWLRYFGSPFSRFTCPDCCTGFTFRRTIYYYLWLLLFSGVLLGGGLVLLSGGMEYQTEIVIIALWFLFMTLAFFVIDRKIEKSLETRIR